MFVVVGIVVILGIVTATSSSTKEHIWKRRRRSGIKGIVGGIIVGGITSICSIVGRRSSTTKGLAPGPIPTKA